MASPLLGHELNSLLLFLLFTSSAVDFISTGPSLTAPPQKTWISASAGEWEPATAASGFSVHHRGFPEDGGGQEAGGTWAQQGVPQEWDCYNTLTCCICQEPA